MLIGNLNNTDRVRQLLPALKTLFDFVKATDFDKLPLGQVPVDGDNVFVMNLNIDGAEQTKQPLEMHRKYIDVHILLGGEEKIGWKPLGEISHLIQNYDPEGDCALSDDAPRFYVSLHPGEFCIVYPEDPHAPAISDGKIRKLIGKVKL